MNDHDLARQLADTAGQVLLSVRSSGVLGGKALGAAGDAVSQAWLAAALQTARPDDAVLSEEAADGARRLDSSRVWVIDPLDGTREYSEGRSDWAVHVALAVDGAPVVAAVALPDQGLVHATDAPPVLAAAPAGRMKLLVSRSRPPQVAEAVAHELDAELVGMGSAGAKAMAVLHGEAHGYVHAGGQYEWDSAAPVGVCASAGLHVSRLDGSPLVYNQPDPLLPDLLICRPEVASALLEALARQLDTTLDTMAVR
jgi:3'(2'), 5'-bisphosphate nucleotidase